MERRVRISFLPAFFTVLIVVFSVAVVLRIRSHRAGDAQTTTSASSAASADQMTEGRPSQNAARSDSAVTQPASLTAPSGGSSSAEAASQAQRAREARYRELLRSANASQQGLASPQASSPPRGPVSSSAPPSASTARQPPQNQSMLSRIVAPIVQAFGGAGSRTPEPAQSGSSSTTTSVPKDPNSDITPPQLLSVQFNPPSIHDGEETVLIVTAADDLSGVRSIAGNVISPSGALLGFSTQRDADSNRYTARIMVPKSSAEGFWRINYLNMTDNASNSTTLMANQLPPTATFRVLSSDADTTPPTLRAVWLDRTSMKAGEKNTLFVQADDDKSGVGLVSGVFISPAKLARIGFGCRMPDTGNTFACDFTPPVNADCGDWQLEQVQLQDKANNMTAVRRDNPLITAVHVAVLSDACDSHPPVVQAVTLDKYATPAPGLIVVRVNVTDDISGVGSVSGHFTYTGPVAPGNQPPKFWFACSMADPQTWSGQVAIPDKAAIGLWRLEQLQVLDKANNLKIYSMADPVISGVSFRVQ